MHLFQSRNCWRGGTAGNDAGCGAPGGAMPGENRGWTRDGASRWCNAWRNPGMARNGASGWCNGWDMGMMPPGGAMPGGMPGADMGMMPPGGAMPGGHGYDASGWCNAE